MRLVLASALSLSLLAPVSASPLTFKATSYGDPGTGPSPTATWSSVTHPGDGSGYVDLVVPVASYVMFEIPGQPAGIDFQDAMEAGDLHYDEVTGYGNERMQLSFDARGGVDHFQFFHEPSGSVWNVALYIGEPPSTVSVPEPALAGLTLLPMAALRRRR